MRQFCNALLFVLLASKYKIGMYFLLHDRIPFKIRNEELEWSNFSADNKSKAISDVLVRQLYLRKLVQVIPIYLFQQALFPNRNKISAGETPDQYSGQALIK